MALSGLWGELCSGLLPGWWRDKTPQIGVGGVWGGGEVALGLVTSTGKGEDLEGGRVSVLLRSVGKWGVSTVEVSSVD